MLAPYVLVQRFAPGDERLLVEVSLTEALWGHNVSDWYNRYAT